MSQAVVPPSPSATITAGIALPLIGGILVALRFYSKHTQRASFQIEDWLTVPALLFTIGLGFCLVYGVAHRAFAYPTPQPIHLKDLPTFVAPEITLNRQLEYVVLMIQIPAITCVKLSFLFFYKRIFCTGAKSRVTYVLWLLIILCISWAISFFFSFVFICGTNVSALWGTLIRFKQHCSRILDWNLWMAVLDFILDIVIFVFPVPLLWRLQMSTTRKLAVTAVFMIGGLTVAASITRMVIVIRAVQNLRKAYKSTSADNGVISTGLYWTTFEVGMALIAVCLPSCYSLFRQFLSGSFGFLSSSAAKRSGRFSGRNAGSSMRRDTGTKLDGLESDMIPLGAPMVTTDIHVDFEDRDARNWDSSRKLGRS